MTDFDIDNFGMQGDSLIEAPSDVVEINTQLRAGGVDFSIISKVNDYRRLRDLRFSFEASNFDDASETSYSVTMPLISRWSFLHDVAITTSGRLIVEESTGSFRLEASVAGEVVLFTDEALQTTEPEHRLLLSAYREGVSSAEPLWQALSFLRIGEGLAKLRERRRARGEGADGRHEGAARIKLDEVLDSDARSALLPYEGQRLNGALSKIHDRLRNTIAHLDPGRPFAHDSYSDISLVVPLLPGLRWVVRRLLEDELRA